MVATGPVEGDRRDISVESLRWNTSDFNVTIATAVSYDWIVAGIYVVCHGCADVIRTSGYSNNSRIHLIMLCEIRAFQSEARGTIDHQGVRKRQRIVAIIQILG